jgi:hypothetical protein
MMCKAMRAYARRHDEVKFCFDNHESSYYQVGRTLIFHPL